MALFAVTVFAQSTYVITGKVLGEDKKPLQGAVVKIERTDIRWNAQLKTNRRGEYTHAGVPAGGTYKIILEVNGETVDVRDGVRPRLGEPAVVDFDLSELKKLRDAANLAAQSGGQLSSEQARALSAEQREEIEKQIKARQAEIGKRKDLNDAFNRGMEAMKAGDPKTAAEAFEKASELDPKQHVIWAQLAEAYAALGAKTTGAEQEAAYNKAIESYLKAMELKPDESAYVNNYALVLVRAKRIPEAQAALEKAAQMDPAQAATYYYNLGAVMMNVGQTEAAGEAFKKAIEANPKYAQAQYQYAIYLVGKAQIAPDGRIQPPPGTREALEAYLQLEPNGQFAQSARDMLATFDQTIQTEYVNPDAKKKTTPAPKKKR